MRRTRRCGSSSAPPRWASPPATTSPGWPRGASGSPSPARPRVEASIGKGGYAYGIGVETVCIASFACAAVSDPPGRGARRGREPGSAQTSGHDPAALPGQDVTGELVAEQVRDVDQPRSLEHELEVVGDGVALPLVVDPPAERLAPVAPGLLPQVCELP